jgi:hypothetical protein
MGSRTGADIAAWQKHCGIEPAYGERGAALEALSQACFEAIKIIELERSGMRDGDGFWHGSDVIGGLCADLTRLCHRLMQSYPPRAPDPPKTRGEHLRRIAADMFNSEARRGWIANSCSWIGRDVDPNISEQEYVELFIERNRDRDLDELEEMADLARPSNMPTAYEREQSGRDVPL